jgi:hypothetical protein
MFSLMDKRSFDNVQIPEYFLHNFTTAMPRINTLVCTMSFPESIALESKGIKSFLIPCLTFKGIQNGDGISASMKWFVKGQTPMAQHVVGYDKTFANIFDSRQIITIVMDINNGEPEFAHLDQFYSAMAMDPALVAAATPEEAAALKGLPHKSLCMMLRAMLSLQIVKPNTIVDLDACGQNTKKFEPAVYNETETKQHLAFITKHAFSVQDGRRTPEEFLKLMSMNINATISLVNYYRSIGFETHDKHTIVEQFVRTQEFVFFSLTLFVTDYDGECHWYGCNGGASLEP